MLDRPHLFLICVDALRADCFDAEAPVWQGVGRPETPALDALRARSRVDPRGSHPKSDRPKPVVASAGHARRVRGRLAFVGRDALLANRAVFADRARRLVARRRRGLGGHLVGRPCGGFFAGWLTHRVRIRALVTIGFASGGRDLTPLFVVAHGVRIGGDVQLPTGQA